MPVCVFAQNRQPVNETEPFYYQSFDNIQIDKEKMEKDSEVYMRALYQPAFSEGITGQALDLTENIPFRLPYIPEPSACPLYDENQSFAVQVWIKCVSIQ